MRDNSYWRSYFLSLGFTAAIGSHSISKEVVGFSSLWFPQGKFFVFLVSCDYCCALLHMKISHYLVILQITFLLPHNLTKSMIWITLAIFFPNLERSALFYLLHKAPSVPSLVDQEAPLVLLQLKKP